MDDQRALGRAVRETDQGRGEYMFDGREHWYMRALSLFHVHMLAVLLWLVWRLGYDSRALLAQTLLAWVVFPLTYVITKPKHNINRVFGPGASPQRRMHPLAYLLLVMIVAPLVIYFPAHLLLQALFAR
jgi:hypothetical protein